MRRNQIKQNSDTLNDTTEDINTNSSDTSVFSNKFNNSEDNSDEIFYPSSHTNSINSNLTQKSLLKLQHRRNNNTVARKSKRN